MKLDTKQLKSEFERELNTKNWFKNIGNHSLDADKIFAPFRVKFTKFKQLPKLLKSNEWSDIDLDIFAEICRFSDQILRQYSLTDDLAATAREILSARKARLIQDIQARSLPSEIYDYSMFPIVLRAFQECGIRKICPNFCIDFNTNLLKILNLGYLPCGWKHDEPKHQQAYNPITFVSDSVRQQDKFGYGDGVLYVY